MCILSLHVGLLPVVAVRRDRATTKNHSEIERKKELRKNKHTMQTDEMSNDSINAGKCMKRNGND